MRVSKEDLPDDEDDLDDVEFPGPPEQAELDALWEVVNAVVEEDKWPRELYWSL